MKAVLLRNCCKVEDLKIEEIEKPKAINGNVVIKIMAFGMNHSEALFRENEVDLPYFQKPVVPGIECTGIIEESLDDDFKIGDKVIAFMGGMGRCFNGSYEEYVLMPKKNVFKINSKLDWLKLAATPETFYTAYGSLFICLDLKSTDSFLVRGGTSALGIASIQFAKAMGCRVIATTTSDKGIEKLQKLGVDKVIVDKGDFKEKMSEKVDKILELVGPKTLTESMRYLKYHGICCSTGILGGVFTLNNYDPIKDIPNGTYLTGFYSNFPKQEEITDMYQKIDNLGIEPLIGSTYTFDDIVKASKTLEDGTGNGKIVIAVDDEIKKLVK